ncbi:MAG: hypothetical protein IJ515_03505 [Clostridia bacterium]|nr:hypothetical protein [Clostridia bacterium]
MDLLKKIFPLSFKYVGEAANLVIGIIIYVVAGIVGGLLIGLFGNIPVLNILCPLLGALLDVYVVAGIVIEILVQCKVIKAE